MIRWIFVIGKDDHIRVDVLDEAEDKRIAECLERPDELLFAPGLGRDAYVNLRAVSLILREVVDEQAEKTAAQTAAQACEA